MNLRSWQANLLIGLFSLLLAGCAGGIRAEAQQSTLVDDLSRLTSTPTVTATLWNTPTLTTPSPTLTKTQTLLPSNTPTLSLPPTLSVAYYPAGQINVPILLYHRIVEGEATNRYEVSLQDFRLQMEFLRRNGYETIAPVELAKVILKGGELPAKPVVITFDDGYRSVYDLAFPVLKQYQFEGVAYVITGYVGAPTYMNADQLIELFANGWEIGSHTVSHEDLVKNPEKAYDQMVESKRYLERLLGTKDLTVAYPYGKADENIARRAARYGYVAGMGLGNSNLHSIGTLYFLSRQEVKSDCDLNCFERIVTGKKIEP